MGATDIIRATDFCGFHSIVEQGNDLWGVGYFDLDEGVPVVRLVESNLTYEMAREYCESAEVRDSAQRRLEKIMATARPGSTLTIVLEECCGGV